MPTLILSVASVQTQVKETPASSPQDVLPDARSTSRTWIYHTRLRVYGTPLRFTLCPNFDEPAVVL